MPPRSDDNAKGSSDEEASNSSSSNSDVSSQDDSSDVSDLEKFGEACTDFGALTDGVDPHTLVATILFRLCRTARHPFSSELRVTWRCSQSIAVPMSVAACI